MLRYRWLTLVLVLLTVRAWAAPPPHFAEELRRLHTAATIADAHVGVYIQSLSHGDIWYDYHADESFIPASTTKILTATLALELLSPAYRFTTTVLAHGPLNDGVLYGDLYLRGEGDPTLQVADLRALAHALAIGDAAQQRPPLRLVAGHLLTDTSFFPHTEPVVGEDWEADDLPWYYASPCSALSCNRNAVTVTVRGSLPGAPPIVTLTPETEYFTVANLAETKTEAADDALTIVPAGQALRIVGHVAPGHEITERLSIADPAHFAAEEFRMALLREGIRVEGMASHNPGAPVVMTAHASAPLAEILTGMLKVSDNHMAEQLRWTLLAREDLQVALPQRFATIWDAFCASRDLVIHGIKQVDGSGLSRNNRVTPADIARLLTYLSVSPNFDTFYRALPIAGVDGTLRKRMVGTPAAGNAHAKTGTMRSVSALAGYVNTQGGERLVYAIYLNGYPGKAEAARHVEDAIVVYLAGLQ